MSRRREFTTMCPMNCHPTLCGMKVSVEDGRPISISGDESNPDSLGFLCMRGKAAHEIVGNDRRLLRPLVRTERGAAGFTEAGWDDALDMIASRSREVGREGRWFLGGARKLRQ